MGGINSYCIGKYPSTNECPENHSKIFSNKGHRRNLSSTFIQVTDDTENHQIQESDLLNINIATEEELMTLPGVNRTTANNIVKYRRQINGFRKVEDLVLVSGIGGDKLKILRAEICVGPRQSWHLSSHHPSQPPPVVALNEANVFSLMKVRGISQLLAERIIAHRDKYGLFLSLESVTKVKGVDSTLLGVMQHQLVLNAGDVPVTPAGTVAGTERDSGTSVDGDSLCAPIDMRLSNGTGNGSIATPVSRHIRSFPSALDNTTACPQLTHLSNLFTGSQLELIGQLEGLAQPVTRPERHQDTLFQYHRSGRQALRLASWNLCRMTEDKARNPGVREVFCLTLLENGISCIALQEVADPQAVAIFCQELNAPQLPNIRRWIGPITTWAYVVSPATGKMFRGLEYNAVLYDTCRGITVTSSKLLQPPETTDNGTDRAFTRSPFIANLKMDGLELLLVSVHLKAAGLTRQDEGRTKQEVEHLPTLCQAIAECIPDGTNALIAGDFNMNPNNEVFDCLRQQAYSNLIPGSEATNNSINSKNGSQAYDNLWISVSGFSRFTGQAGVIRDGLRHPFIPQLDSFSWNGSISDHCPVYAEFFVDTKKPV